MDLLSAVKTEFNQFGTILEKTKKKLQEATNTIDKAGTRSRAIESQLRKVQELPSSDSATKIVAAIETDILDGDNEANGSNEDKDD